MSAPQWDFEPEYSYKIEESQPPVLMEPLEGNRVLRRRKPGVNALRVRELHQLSYLDFVDARTIWQIYGMHTALTKRTYLDQPVAGVHNEVDLWFFASKLVVLYKMVDVYRFQVDWDLAT